MQTRLLITGTNSKRIECPEPILAVAAGRRGFTLVELCVILATIAIIGVTLLPALARTRPETRIGQCINNARQIAAAVQMYTADYNDLFPPNPDNGGVFPGYTWCFGNVAGGMPSGGIQLGPETFNSDVMTNASLCLIAPYLNGNGMVFSCPADPRIGTYQGTNAALIGQTVHAARSVSMDMAVGTVDPGWLGPSGTGGGTIGGKPIYPVPGRWLTGNLGQNKHDNPWATFGKTADFRVIRPSQVFLITDEDPYSINDNVLVVSAGLSKFIDYPATFHNHACTISFCDGHVELHRWLGTAIVLNSPASMKFPSASADLADWNWLWQHATVRMH